MDTTSALRALAALGHPLRLATFRTLVQGPRGGLAVGELRESLGIPGSSLTAHLHRLRAAGLVEDRREGRIVRVRARVEAMHALMDYLLENCCAGQTPCPPPNPEDRGPACR